MSNIYNQFYFRNKYLYYRLKYLFSSVFLDNIDGLYVNLNNDNRQNLGQNIVLLYKFQIKIEV